MIEKIEFKFDFKMLHELYLMAEKSAKWSQSFPTVQSGIQTTTDDDSDYLSSCQPGILSKDEKKFQELHRLYKKTYFEEFLKRIPIKICRLRWMVLHPKSCYSLHKDGTKRFHIPIITNKQCYLIFQDLGDFHHLEEGKPYIMDATKPHTAINGGEEIRVHLVGCIYD